MIVCYSLIFFTFFKLTNNLIIVYEDISHYFCSFTVLHSVGGIFSTRWIFEVVPKSGTRIVCNKQIVIHFFFIVLPVCLQDRLLDTGLLKLKG